MCQLAFPKETKLSNHDCDATPPLLLRAPQAAALLSTSVRTLRVWNATGKVPRPIRIGQSIYWRPEELKAWVAAGCPDRVTWEAMQQL